MSYRIPRWMGLVAWPTLLGMVHVALPVELSRHRRHGWNERNRPGRVNLLGLAPLAAGAGLVSWSLAKHYAAAPDRSWAIKRTIEPEYLLTEGPYRFSRNPMDVGGMAIWGGWTIFFGSGHVALGLVVLATGFRASVAWEEKALERRWGHEWRSYAARTPRWASP